MSPVRRIERGLRMNLLNFRAGRITVPYYFIPVIFIYVPGQDHGLRVPSRMEPLRYPYRSFSKPWQEEQLVGLQGEPVVSTGPVWSALRSDRLINGVVVPEFRDVFFWIWMPGSSEC